MIRDRIVVGIRDEAMSQKLQLDADLTLESAKKMVRQREAVKEQQVQLKSGFQKERLPVEDVGAGAQFQKFNKRRKPINKLTESARPRQPTTRNRCTRCGHGQHSRLKCPAKEATCHSCKKKGHSKSQCRSNVSEVTEDCSADLDDTSFLDAVSDERGSIYLMKRVPVGEWTHCNFQNRHWSRGVCDHRRDSESPDSKRRVGKEKHYQTSHHGI